LSGQNPKKFSPKVTLAKQKFKQPKPVNSKKTKKVQEVLMEVDISGNMHNYKFTCT